MVYVAVLEDGHGGRCLAALQRLAEMDAEDAEYEVWRMVDEEAWGVTKPSSIGSCKLKVLPPSCPPYQPCIT